MLGRYQPFLSVLTWVFSMVHWQIFSYYGDGTQYPDYLHSFYLEASRYTLGSSALRFYYDSDALFKGKNLHLIFPIWSIRLMIFMASMAWRLFINLPGPMMPMRTMVSKPGCFTNISENCCASKPTCSYP